MVGVWNDVVALLGMVALSIACSSRPMTSARDVADANDTGRTVNASSAAERAVLAVLSSLPSGSPKVVSGLTVLAQAPYSAASGRTCRALNVRPEGTDKASARLACSNDGKSWFFVPAVLAGEGSAE
jgi:hypothetical protein